MIFGQTRWGRRKARHERRGTYPNPIRENVRRPVASFHSLPSAWRQSTAAVFVPTLQALQLHSELQSHGYGHFLFVANNKESCAQVCACQHHVGTAWLAQGLISSPHTQPTRSIRTRVVDIYATQLNTYGNISCVWDGSELPDWVLGERACLPKHRWS